VACNGPTRRQGSRRRRSTTRDRSCQPTVRTRHDDAVPWSPQDPGRRPSTTPDRSCQPDGESASRRQFRGHLKAMDGAHQPRRTGRVSRTVSPRYDEAVPWSPQPRTTPSTKPDRSYQPDGESLTRRRCSVVTVKPQTTSADHAGQVVPAGR